MLHWRPITDCEKWNPLAVPSHILLISGTIITLGALLIVGFLWVLPDHVFGTSKYLYKQGEFPQGIMKKILRSFVYRAWNT